MYDTVCKLFKHSAGFIISLGVRGMCPKCYFPNTQDKIKTSNSGRIAD